jgi:hypothetical protein
MFIHVYPYMYLYTYRLYKGQDFTLEILHSTDSDDLFLLHIYIYLHILACSEIYTYLYMYLSTYVSSLCTGQDCTLEILHSTDSEDLFLLRAVIKYEYNVHRKTVDRHRRSSAVGLGMYNLVTTDVYIYKYIYIHIYTYV